MASFKEIQRKLKKATDNRLQKKVAEFVVIDLDIRDKKRDEYKRGDKPNGSLIGVYRSEAYRQYKLRKNPLAGGDVDLIDTGKFSNQLFVKSLGERKFIFKSQDEKEDLLKEKYGEDIMGFNEDTFLELQQNKYRDKLVIYIKQITGIK